MESRSIHRFARIAPTKVRPVAELIKGLTVEEAYAVLEASRKRGARFLEKVLRAAEAHILDEREEASSAEIIVEKVWVDEGPRMKRWRPRAFGRAFPILKRTSHIGVVVRYEEPGNGSEG